MVKAKSFMEPFFSYSGSLMPHELFVNYSAANRFIDEIGADRVISISGDQGSQVAIFYIADGLLTCPDCNQDHAPDQSFCHLCGKQLVPVTQPEAPACPLCGKPLLPKAAFCSFCGESVKGSKLKGLWG